MQSLLKWYDINRRDLPWRNIKNPYYIWLSEIILQQTRVEFGLKYYQRFIEQFPKIEDLAYAEENEVLKLWQGLGYYSRARNLHFSAKMIVRELNNQFPNNFRDLKQLKGVGNYTASAIASICFNEPVPAMDGNAYRVYARFFNLNKDITVQKNQTYFFELGKETISKKRPGDFNQAIMDLGSQVCKPKNPDCTICPLNTNCMALEKGTVLELPVKTKKVKIKKRKLQFLFIYHENDFLLNKNTSNNIWKNLYLLPLYEFSNQKKFLKQMHFEFDIKPEKSLEIKHQLTHQTLNIQFWEIELDKQEFSLISNKLMAEIITHNQLENYPIPKPIEVFLTQIQRYEN